MKNLFSLIIILLSVNTLSFTLLSSNVPRYSTEDVVFNVSNNSCPLAGLTPESTLDLIEEAMDKFWNTVPTANIRFIRGTVLTSVSVNGETSLNDVLTNNGSINTILVGCNDDAFVGKPSTLGIGTIAGIGGVALGGFLIQDSNIFTSISSDQRLATLAHELGHAIGIGHSKSNFALMYHEVGATQTHLTQDDFDAITDLYPREKKLGGLIGSCGTIAFIDDKTPPSSGLMTLSLGFMLAILGLYSLKKAQFIITGKYT
jgi:hypothetical protein